MYKILLLEGNRDALALRKLQPVNREEKYHIPYTWKMDSWRYFLLPGQALSLRDGVRHPRPKPDPVLLAMQRLHPRGASSRRKRPYPLVSPPHPPWFPEISGSSLGQSCRHVPQCHRRRRLHHVRDEPLLEGGAEGGEGGQGRRQSEHGLPETAAGFWELQAGRGGHTVSFWT